MAFLDETGLGKVFEKVANFVQTSLDNLKTSLTSKNINIKSFDGTLISIPSSVTRNFQNGFLFSRGSTDVLLFNCTTAANIQEKMCSSEVLINGIPTIDNSVRYIITEGTKIAVRFAYANSVQNPILSVRIGSGNIIAGPIKLNNSNLTSNNYWNAGAVVEFIYANNSWHMVGALSSSNGSITDTNTTYTFTNGTDGSFVVTPSSGTAATVSIGKPSTAGTADYASQVKVKSNNAASSFPILFTGGLGSSTGTNQYLYTDSETTNGLRYNPNSNILFSGGGFYESSDEKLKDFKNDLCVDFDQLKNIPKKYFTWKEDENQILNIGTSAQEIQKIYPELVSDNDGVLTVDYAKLSIIALAAIDKLNAKIEELEAKLNKLS